MTGGLDINEFLARQEAADAKLPLADRVRSFIERNESIEGVKVWRRDNDDGSVELLVLEHGLDFKGSVRIAEGVPTQWPQWL